MKLQTSIPPRRDGTITVTAKDGKRIVFAPGPDGELVGDVTDEATVAELIDGGMFWPADPADYDIALALTGADKGGDSADDDEADDDSDDGDDGDDSAPPAPPVEANTPPAAPKPRAGRAAAKTPAAKTAAAKTAAGKGKGK